MQFLLNQARHTKNVDEFFRNIKQANFSPPKSDEKLAVIQHHLKMANNKSDVSKDDLYSFLKHFHLLSYDLGDETGVILSLLHSHISLFKQQDPQLVWSRVVDIVQAWNKDAGTIIPERLPEDLREAFKIPVLAQIPAEFTTSKPEAAETDWSRHPHATELALVNFIGAWNEKNDADIEVLQKLIGEDYSPWVVKMRQILHLPDSPLSLKNGIWQVTDRPGLWASLGPRIFDQNLDTFKEVVVAVLTERDPAFDLPPEDRYAANIHGKVLSHSPAFRKGSAEGLAILGSEPKVFINSSRSKPEATAILAIREIFTDADWVLWGSLNDLLPTMAEAAPEEFLNAVEHALSLSPCPFDELFSQEGTGITGRNYLTGLLWALEGLAWDENYLVRVCVLLVSLPAMIPGVIGQTGQIIPSQPFYCLGFPKQLLLLKSAKLLFKHFVRSGRKLAGSCSSVCCLTNTKQQWVPTSPYGETLYLWDGKRR